MSDETRLLELFRPNRESYTVCYSVANGRDKDGKRNGNYATYHRDGKGYVRLRKDKQGNVIEKIQKPSLEVAARRHLDGLERLVLKPQLEDGSCSWGALDHDHYNAQTSQVITEEIRARGLPLYPFPSKSDGLHSFAFTERRHADKLMTTFLRKCSADLGDNTCEVNPKEVAPGAIPYGIEIPFFGDREAFRSFAPKFCDTELLESQPSGRGGEELGPRDLGRSIPLTPGVEYAISQKLNFQKRQKGEFTYLDYHGLAGKDGKPQPCLIQGSVHAGHGKTQSSFVIGRGRLWHACFDSDCRKFSAANPVVYALEKLNLAEKTETQASKLGCSVAELFMASEKVIEWLCWPFAAQGFASILDALPKVGKTVFLLQGIYASRMKLPFLGYPTKPVRAVFVSEQSRASLAAQMREVGFTGEEPPEEFWVITREDWSRYVYKDFLAQLEKEILTGNAYNLLVLDTFHSIARLEDERDASETNQAGNLTLDLASRFNLALALGRHDRKSGGEVGLSGRSSIQLSGLMDVVLHLVRMPGGGPATQRKLELLGRITSLPNELIINLRDDAYVNLGTPGDREKAEEDALEALLTAEPTVGYRTIARRTGIAKDRIKKTAEGIGWNQGGMADGGKRRNRAVCLVFVWAKCPDRHSLVNCVWVSAVWISTS